MTEQMKLVKWARNLLEQAYLRQEDPMGRIKEAANKCSYILHLNGVE